MQDSNLSISIFYIFNLRNILFKDIILTKGNTFLIVIVDLFIEFIFGKYFRLFFGLYRKITSFTGDELKIGNFFLAFSFIFITVYNKIKDIKILFILILIITILGFLIGERANLLGYYLLQIYLFFYI